MLPHTVLYFPQVGLSPAHGLVGVAGEDGRLECFDPRQRTAVGTLDAAAAAGAVSTRLTALCCKTDIPKCFNSSRRAADGDAGCSSGCLRFR